MWGIYAAINIKADAARAKPDATIVEPIIVEPVARADIARDLKPESGD